MEMSDRVKEVRNSKGMSQAEFSKMLGIGQSTLAMMEVSKRKISERHIKTICSICNIEEQWLRTGEGPMYVERESSTLTQVTNLLKLDDTEQKFLAAYLNLPPEIKKNLKETCRQVVDFYSSQNETAASSFAKNGEISRTMENAEIEKELAAYRSELEAESRGKILPLSENTEKGRNLA